MFIDSHAHLTCDPVFESITEILDRAQKEKVGTIINICTDKLSLERGLKLSETYKWVYNVGATTPHDVDQEGEIYFSLFEEAAREGRLVAIGETGLDYYYEHSPKLLQQEFLVRYFDLAKSCNLPVVIHCREAFEDLFRFAQEHYSSGKAVLHCFTGTLKEAEEAIDRGWLISFSGIITFKKSEDLRKVVERIPLNRMLIETDTPYLAPQTKRGKPNEPAFICETSEIIAAVKGCSTQDVAEMTAVNARDFFQLPNKS